MRRPNDRQGKAPPALEALIAAKALTPEERKLAERIAFDLYPVRFIVHAEEGRAPHFAIMAALVNDWPLDRIDRIVRVTVWLEPFDDAVAAIKAGLAMIAARHA